MGVSGVARVCASIGMTAAGGLEPFPPGPNSSIRGAGGLLGGPRTASALRLPPLFFVWPAVAFHPAARWSASELTGLRYSASASGSRCFGWGATGRLDCVGRGLGRLFWPGTCSLLHECGCVSCGCGSI